MYVCMYLRLIHGKKKLAKTFDEKNEALLPILIPLTNIYRTDSAFSHIWLVVGFILLRLSCSKIWIQNFIYIQFQDIHLFQQF